MSETPLPPMLSPDGRYLWDGNAWRALSPDGRSYWDGVGWQPVAGPNALPWPDRLGSAGPPPEGRHIGSLALLIGGTLVLIVLVVTVAIVIRVADGGATATGPRPQTDGAAADHWHVAVGLNICGTFVPPLSDVNNYNDGVHTHGDGIAHVHPKTASAAGANATLGRWLTDVGADVTASEMKLPGRSRMANGRECPDGNAGEVRAMVWPSPASDAVGKLVKGDPSDIRLRDGELITIAFLPADADTPQPPSATYLRQFFGSPS